MVTWKTIIKAGSTDGLEQVITKPCQARKTPEIQYLIENNLEAYHIVVSDNYCAQGDQLYHRLTQTLGKPPVLLHGGAEDTKDYKGLAFRMIVEDIRCIISLSNSVRLPVTAKTLELVFKHTDRRLFVYLDEGDKIAKQFYKNCKDVLTANSDRTDLFFVTATPGSLFKDLGSLNVHLNQFDLADYKPLKSYDWNFVDSSGDTCLDQIDDMMCHVKLSSSNLYFVPGSVARVSHRSIGSHFATKYNSRGIAINGDGITYYTPDDPAGTVYPNLKNHCRDDDCDNPSCKGCYGSTQLIDRIEFFRVKAPDESFFITGNNCLGRGVTIVKPGMSITHALLTRDLVGGRGNAISKRADLYQLAARPANSYGAAMLMDPVMLTTDAKLKDIVLESEFKATALAERYGGQRVTHEDFVGLEPDNLSSVPLVIDVSASDFDRILAAKARRGGRYNADIVGIVRCSPVYAQLTAEGYQLHLKKNAVSSVVFADSGPAATVVKQLANAVEAGKGVKPKGKLPGGKWLHAFADFRPEMRRIYVLKTDKPLVSGEQPPQIPPPQSAPGPSSPDVRDILDEKQLFHVGNEELGSKMRTLLSMDEYQSRLRVSDPNACVVRRQLKVDFPALDKYMSRYKDTRLKELVADRFVARVKRGRCATYEVTAQGHAVAVSKRSLFFGNAV